MAGSPSTSSAETKISENGNGLILYQYYPSYYCQKVVFALNEKKIKYKSRIIDLYRGEQFEPWFIKINPKLEVPVLKDGVKIIPDSRRIIDYLEDNFSNGSTPRLIPEKGSPQFQMMERLRDMLDNLPINVVTFGCLLNPQLTGKINLSPQEIKIRKSVHAAHDSLLNDMIERHPDFKDYYLVKKQAIDRLRMIIAEPTEVEKGIMDVEYALNTVEKELATHDGDKKNWWVCSDKFTVADISLCVLLNRVNAIGLLEKFLPSMPHLRDYWARAQRRDSLRRAFYQGSSLLGNLRSLPARERVMVGVGGAAVVTATAALAVYLIAKSRK